MASYTLGYDFKKEGEQWQCLACSFRGPTVASIKGHIASPDHTKARLKWIPPKGSLVRDALHPWTIQVDDNGDLVGGYVWGRVVEAPVGFSTGSSSSSAPPTFVRGVGGALYQVDEGTSKMESTTLGDVVWFLQGHEDGYLLSADGLRAYWAQGGQMEGTTGEPYSPSILWMCHVCGVHLGHT